MRSPVDLWVYLSTSPLIWLTLTLCTWIGASELSRRVDRNPLANPVLTSILFLSLVMTIFDIPYERFFEGAQFVHFLLGPATVAIAVPLFRQWARVKRLLLPIAAALMVGSQAGAPFELVWRNEELSDPPGQRPEGFPEEQRMESHVIEAEPPHRLTFAWRQGEVSFQLTPKGDQVLLTIIHRRISDRANTVMIGAGWHMHLNILAARLSNRKPQTFWDGWSRLRDDYDRRLPA